MTDIERIESIILELEYNYISYDNLHGDDEQGCKIIKAALEKQIPESPADVNYDSAGIGSSTITFIASYECPNCHEIIEYDKDFKDVCPHCGQLLDWANFTKA